MAECSLKNLNKMFSTDVPVSYLQHIKSKVVPSHGFSIDVEKETYTVKVLVFVDVSFRCHFEYAYLCLAFIGIALYSSQCNHQL